jgi:hypothetical protein
VAAEAGAVVGEYPADGLDAVRGEEVHRPAPETRCGGGFLVGEFLGVGQSGAVVDRDV